MKNFLLVGSILLNATLGITLLFFILEGCAEPANGRIGILSRDIQVGTFGVENVLFTLPRGLIVRDASASGEGWFEPHRFRLIVTSDDPALVDYSQPSTEDTGQTTEHYSCKSRN